MKDVQLVILFLFNQLIISVLIFQILYFYLIFPACLGQPGQMVTVTYGGFLKDTVHEISGVVYILNEKLFVIDKFSFDGLGFGVSIYVAVEGRNLQGYEKHRMRVLHPEIREKHDGNTQLVVDVGKIGVNTKDVKWLSIWCDALKISFGHVIL